MLICHRFQVGPDRRTPNSSIAVPTNVKNSVVTPKKPM